MPTLPMFDRTVDDDEEDDELDPLVQRRRELDPLGAVPQVPGAEDEEEDQTSQFEHTGPHSTSGVSTPRPEMPTAPPGPAHYPRPALDSLRQHTAQMPELPDPKKAPWWAKLANVAYSAGAGWTNAAGRTHVDPNAGRGLLQPGYGHAMQKWQLEQDKLKQQAELEGKQSDIDLRMETQKARQEAYEAMKARANRPAGTGTPAKVASYDPEEVAKRQDVANKNGWTEDKHPGVTEWVASGKWGSRPKAATAAGPKAQPIPWEEAVLNDPATSPEQKQRAQDSLDAKGRSSKLKEDELRSRIGMHNRSNQGGGDAGPKPLSTSQRLIASRRLDQDKQKAYQQAERDFADQSATVQAGMRSKDPNIRAQAQQAYQDLLSKHNARKQEIEENFKRGVEDMTGSPQPRVKFGGANPVAKSPVQNAPAPQAAQPGQKVANRQMIQAFAQKHNLTPEQAIEAAKRDGYVIQ